MVSNAIIIAGPTASGKTKLAFEIAQKIPSVIINADSMQIYNNLRILTNIPDEDELEKNHCKLFSCISAPSISDLGWWIDQVMNEIKVAKSKKLVPIIVGGSGLYLNGLENQISYIPKVKQKVRKKINQLHELKGNNFFYEKLLSIDPTYSKIVNPNDTHRIMRAIEVKVSTGKNLSYWHNQKNKKKYKDNNYMFLVIQKERRNLYELIDKRFVEMIKKGVIEEVKFFLDTKIDITHPIYKAIGLKHIKDYLEGKIKIEDVILNSQRDSRNYAKRQITWFKHQPNDPIFVEQQKAKEIVLKKFRKLM